MVNVDILEAVQRSLEKDGSLQAIRAQLRRNVLKVLNDTSGRNSLPNAALSSFGSSEKGRTILLMVYDLLDTLGLKESLSVFEAEANCKKPSNDDYDTIAEKLNLSNCAGSLLERFYDSRQAGVAKAYAGTEAISNTSLNESLDSSRQSAASSTPSPKQLSPIEKKRMDKGILDSHPPPRSHLHSLHPLGKSPLSPPKQQTEDKPEEQSFGEQSTESSHDFDALMESSNLLKRTVFPNNRMAADPLPAPKQLGKPSLAPLPDLKRPGRVDVKDVDSSFEESTSMLAEDADAKGADVATSPQQKPERKDEEKHVIPIEDEDSVAEELDESIAEDDFEETADDEPVVLPVPLSQPVKPLASTSAEGKAREDKDGDEDSQESEEEKSTADMEPLGPEHDSSESEFSASDAAFLTAAEIAAKKTPSGPATKVTVVKEVGGRDEDDVKDEDVSEANDAPGRANVQRLGSHAVTRSTHGWDSSRNADIDMRDEDDDIIAVDAKPRSGGGLLASLRMQNRQRMASPEVEEVVEVHDESASFEDSRQETSAHLGQSMRSSNQDEEEEEERKGAGGEDEDDYDDDYENDELVIDHDHSDLDSPARPVKPASSSSATATTQSGRLFSNSQSAGNQQNVSMTEDYDYGEDFEDDAEKDGEDEEADSAVESPVKKPSSGGSLFSNRDSKPTSSQGNSNNNRLATAAKASASEDDDESVEEEIQSIPEEDMSVGADSEDEEAGNSSGGLFRQRSGMLPPANKPKASAGGLNFDSLNDFDDDDDDGFNPSAYLNNAQKPSAKPQSFGDEDDEDMVDTPKVQMRHSLPPPLRGNSNASSTARVEEDEFSAGEGDSGDFDMN